MHAASLRRRHRRTALREDWNLTVEAAPLALAEVPVVPGDLLDPRSEAYRRRQRRRREKRCEKTPRPPPPPQAPTRTSCARREKRRRRSATRWRRFDTPSETSWRIAPSSGGTSTRFDSPARWRPAMRSPPRPSPARSRRFSRRRSVARRSRRRSRARTRGARAHRAARGGFRRRAAAERSPRSPRRRAPSRSNLASRGPPPPPPEPDSIIESYRASPALVAETLAVGSSASAVGFLPAPAVSVAAVQARVPRRTR